MSNLGVGVMLHMLGVDDTTAPAITLIEGATISAIRLDPEGDGALVIESDRGTVRIFDGGRSCCESRYMSCDDDLADVVGARVLAVETRDGGSSGDDDCHEIQFLIVRTSKGDITVATHNEHNGYYGGFALRAEIVK